MLIGNIGMRKIYNFEYIYATDVMKKKTVYGEEEEKNKIGVVDVPAKVYKRK